MRNENRALTGLRGLAAGYVALYHLTQGLPGDGVGFVVLRNGYLSVDLFFVLSGFVLAMVHGRDTFDRKGYGAFLHKRFARIYPLYAIVLATTVALAVSRGVVFSPGHLAVNAVLLQAWDIGGSIVAPGWSLSAELGAYLLFPALCALVLWGTRLQAAVLACAAFAFLAAIAVTGYQPRSGPLDLYQANTVAPLVRCLCDFVLGLLAYRASCRHDAPVLAHPATGVCSGVFILGLLMVKGADLAIVPLMAVLVAALARNRDGVVGRACASTVVHWLGTISFSIYLVHYGLREYLRDPLTVWIAARGLPHPNVWATLATCAAILAVAQVTFRTIEEPMRALLRPRRRVLGRAS